MDEMLTGTMIFKKQKYKEVINLIKEESEESEEFSSGMESY